MTVRVATTVADATATMVTVAIVASWSALGPIVIPGPTPISRVNQSPSAVCAHQPTGMPATTASPPTAMPWHRAWARERAVVEPDRTLNRERTRPLAARGEDGREDVGRCDQTQQQRHHGQRDAERRNP